MNLEEKLYTSTEVAKILGVSLRSVYRYLDQGKLDAEIKTVTGRLRFTKKDILNFLYPDGDADPEVVASHFSKVANSGDTSSHKDDVIPSVKPTKIEPVVEVPEAENPSHEDKFEDEENTLEEAPIEENDYVGSVNTQDEEEIDWLAKFRAAAKEYSQASSFSSSTPTSANPGMPPRQPLSNIEHDAAHNPALVNTLGSSQIENKEPSIEHYYYKSTLGGLKEIAQNIDKVARKSSVDYAFTLYAGLSLEKPLKKPFSILHVYINPSTEALFQKMLQLEPTDENNAQLCIMFPKTSSVFANKVEKHGLYVVDANQMDADFEDMGLASELEGLL
ncbi:helix-turn-helix domain-containing protein [Patescibacteria group bacterium]|nr:helix-turn-helix domain-containing protein [Patescibacteria group bacterium]HOM78179.1 helix-turn-helix domain-containing protein [bacterium]